MEIVKTTHLGNIRKNNEDAMLVKEKDGMALLVIADGMGGHNAGEVASGMAVMCICEYVFDHPEDEPGNVLRAAVRYANNAIYERAKNNAAHRGMGTTITAALIKSGRVTIANVGDSRVYRMSQGSLEQITVDHSYVQQLVQRGVITPEEAKTHPRRNLITRSVGITARVKTDVFHGGLRSGDVMLLCSDGLTSHVNDKDIEKILNEDCMLTDKIENLKTQALNAGGSDNITIILAKE